MSEGLNHISVLPALCSSSVPGSGQMLRKTAVGLSASKGSQPREGDKGVKGNDQAMTAWCRISQGRDEPRTLEIRVKTANPGRLPGRGGPTLNPRG